MKKSCGDEITFTSSNIEVGGAAGIDPDDDDVTSVWMDRVLSRRMDAGAQD